MAVCAKEQVIPAPDDGAELTDQHFLYRGRIRLDDRPDFLQEGVRILL